MKWSFRLGQIFGITIYVHATFLLLLLWIALGEYLQSRNIGAAASGVLFILMVFGTVVLHELSHALTAKRFGIQTRDIILLPIGGIARMDRLPENPRQGLLVSLAGPALNIVIALILLAFLVATSGWEAASPQAFVKGSFLARFMWVNISLAVFNLLPAFPLDGGRILRNILAMRMDPARATQIAAGLGQAMAFLFGLLGLFFNPLLVLIAFFLWLGAGAEAAMAQMKSGLAGTNVSRAMITDFRTLSANDTLARAVELVLEGFQTDFPVVDEGRLIGLLTRSDLMKDLAQKGVETLVADSMKREFPVVHPLEKIEEVFPRLHEGGSPLIPVVSDGRLVGILTAENIAEFLMVRSALKKNS